MEHDENEKESKEQQQQQTPPELNTSSPEKMMAYGSEAMYAALAHTLERSLGRELPQVEIRFKNMNLSADIAVASKSSRYELPTLWNTLVKSLGSMMGRKEYLTKHILRDFSGYFAPGRTTLVLGQGSSGKSSLMKVLSGRFPFQKNIHLEGEITYNGIPREEIPHVIPQLASYVDQYERHYPTLTVRETMEYGHIFCDNNVKDLEKHMVNGTPEENAAAVRALNALYDYYVDIAIGELGLTNCQHTNVGNAMIRGISGGEKKRLTTGEMYFGLKYATFMDEISTGLDSAATSDIINTQIHLAKSLHRTLIISLLQPPPEVFNMFDDVMIFNDGYVIYHGPIDQASAYFEGLGFFRPADRDMADFLLDLSTAHQGRYQKDLPNLPVDQQPHHPREFAAKFKESEIYQKTLEHLDEPLHEHVQIDNEEFIKKTPKYHLSILESTYILMKRQLTITLRNKPFIRGRAFMIILMAFIYGSLFWKTSPSEAQVLLGVLFGSVLFLSLGQMSQLPTYFDARDVYYKQRGLNFFPSVSYVFSNSVGQIPMALGESVLFGCVVYWMCGLESRAGSFFLFLAILFLTNMVFTTWFLLVSAFTPNLSIAKPTAGLTVAIFILFGGFLVTKDNIPDYLIWLYWLDPVAWCVRALAINQYKHSEYGTCNYGGTNYCEEYGMTVGEYALNTFGIPSESEYLWSAYLYLIACFLLFLFLAVFTYEHIRFETPEDIAVEEDEEDTSEDYVAISTPRGNEGGDGENPTSSEVVDGKYESHFSQVTLAFRNLHYSVYLKDKTELELLNGIDGYALPKTMTALMGSTGAGKTTLMDVIAGRKTGGKITGDILLNGYSASDLAIRRATGYCEQMDIHCEGATYREALSFSAFLRQSSDISDEVKYDTVDECLDLLELRHIADQIIRGGSAEQLKRLTIGVELAAQPSILFLDEPTSGLDARTAKLIMEGVRKVALTGRTIVCTIHQPSYEVFSLFDNLLLLKKGGELVYFGEIGDNCDKMIEYFSSIPNAPKLPKGYNPATWMLEVIGAGVDKGRNHTDVDFVKYFKDSKECKSLYTVLDQDGVSRPQEGVAEIKFEKKRASKGLTQFKFLMQRFNALYWRTPSYNLSRALSYVFLALLLGITYVGSDYNSYSGVNSGIGIIFISTVFIGVISMNAVLPVTSAERAAYYRERSAQTYNALWYFMAGTLVEIPYCFGSALLFTAIYYFFVGFTGFGHFVFYWITASSFLMVQVYMGQFFVYALPSIEVAVILGTLLYTIFFLFMGYNPPASSIPDGYIWLYYLCPPRYAVAAFAGVTLSYCSEDGDGLGCNLMGDDAPDGFQNATIKYYVETNFKYKHSEMWMNFGIVWAWIGFLRIISLLALRFINHQKR